MKRLLSALVAAAVVVSLAQADTGEDFYPISKGRQWEYQTQGTTQVFVKGALERSTALSGKTSDVVLGLASTGPPGAVTIETNDVVRQEVISGAGQATELVTRYRSTVTSNGLDVMLLRQEEIGGEKARLPKPIVYNPPIHILKARPAKNGTWDVGTLRISELLMPTRGEVIGRERVETPAGVFERCLKVRRVSSITGVLETPNGAVRVNKGTQEETVWLAPGVGRVRSVALIEQDVILPNGQQATLKETKGRILIRYE